MVRTAEISGAAPPVTYGSLVTRRKIGLAVQQAITWSTTVFSYVVLSPALTKIVTHKSKPTTWPQFRDTCLWMGATTLLVVVANMPLGHLIQRPDLGKGNGETKRSLSEHLNFWDQVAGYGSISAVNGGLYLFFRSNAATRFFGPEAK